MAIKDLFKGLSSVRKRFIDNFNRANQSGLGTPSDGSLTDGSLWNIIRGSWSITTNAAVGVNNSYPMATQTMPTSNNQVSIVSTSQGAAAALWITDANNWWAVGMTQEPENCNCTYFYNTTYYYFTTNCPAYNAGTWNAATCNGTWNFSFCNAPYFFCTGNYNGSNCNNFAYNATNRTTRCSGSYNASNCNSWGQGCAAVYNGSNCNGTVNVSNLNQGNLFYYACNQQGSTISGPFASCSTCYPQYIRIWQSVAGTISLITQWSIGATLAAAFKVKTSGSQITTSVYSDSSAVTQIGSDLVYTPSGITITPTFGITIAPSTYNQGYSIDSVEITRN